MLDQSFTSENFRKIFDYENRRGVYLEGRFFPEIEKITQEIKKCTTNARNLKRKRATLAADEYQEQISELYDKKDELKEKKEKLLKKELEQISTNITSGNFEINLEEVSTPSGKAAYKTQDEACAYFAIKQIQYNIRKLYKVKQSNRHSIICQLKNILSDRYPKYLIRTDIKEFYESIPREPLLKKIDQDPLLTLSSKKIIRMILRKYEALSGNSKGVPRGIGISAYLAELYMRDFDRNIKAHDEVIFYARYVDDIVVVYAPKPNSQTKAYSTLIKCEARKIGLKINHKKTNKHDMTVTKENILNYLGYKITYGNGEFLIGFTDEKRERHKGRIRRSFEVYKKHANTNEKKARKMLVKRIQFLTSNTRLHNNKGNVLIGSYYSNSLINHLKDLEFLDNCLKSQIGTLASDSLKKRLEKYSFIEGFERKKFTPFKIRELTDIVKLWKYEA